MNKLESLEICLWIRKSQVYKAVFVYVPLLWIKIHKAKIAISWIMRWAVIVLESLLSYETLLKANTGPQIINTCKKINFVVIGFH